MVIHNEEHDNYTEARSADNKLVVEREGGEVRDGEGGVER